MKREDLWEKILNLIVSGQMKASVDKLNESMTQLHQNMILVNSTICQLNQGVSSSNQFLKEIADLNKAASSQTNAIYILTGVMVFLGVIQILIMKGFI